MADALAAAFLRLRLDFGRVASQKEWLATGKEKGVVGGLRADFSDTGRGGGRPDIRCGCLFSVDSLAIKFANQGVMGVIFEANVLSRFEHFAQ